MTEYRNATRNADGSIDCEINHPEFGWIPFTASPDDPEEFGRDVHAQLDSYDLPASPISDPTSADVDAELVRRILAGSVFYVTGYASPIPLRGDDRTQKYLSDRGTKASISILKGQPSVQFVWRDAANVNHTFTAVQIAELAEKGATWIEAITKVSWDLKDDPAGIPVDFTDDSYWISES